MYEKVVKRRTTLYGFTAYFLFLFTYFFVIIEQQEIMQFIKPRSPLYSFPMYLLIYEWGFENKYCQDLNGIRKTNVKLNVNFRIVFLNQLLTFILKVKDISLTRNGFFC